MQRTPDSVQPLFAFRLWHGMGVKAWFGLLARNGFAISAGRWPSVIEICAYALLNSTLGGLQRLIFGRRLAALEITPPPVFIIGHWRAGTTLLHELLTLDSRFTAPTTYECFVPGHFLMSSWLARALTAFLPSRRPMDDMAVGWERPQEDEFALMNMGLGSFYETMAFPNHRPLRREFIQLADVPRSERNAWQRGLLRFLKQVLWRRRRQDRQQGLAAPERRLVLKSPQRTAQIDVLLELFPDARFNHIVRHPYEVFASTMRLWPAFCSHHSLQKPRWEQLPGGTPSLEDFVLDTFDLLYSRFAEHKALIAPRRFHEVRYEDLIREPTGEMAKLYAQLEL